MRKIITGKIYNTETATEVAKDHNGYGYTDFDYCCDTLYRSPRGAWFLHGRGGARSKYAQWSGKSVYGGAKIVPMTEEEARNFAEDHADPETYQKYFSIVEA